MPTPATTSTTRPTVGGITPTLADGDLERERERDEHGGALGRGEMVGRYVILERIGSGGMGVVYSGAAQALEPRPRPRPPTTSRPLRPRRPRP